MTQEHDHAPSLDLEEQALNRTIVPAAHGHAHERDGDEHDDHEHDDHEHAFEWTEMVRIALVGLAAAAVWFRVWEPVSALSIVGVAGLLIGGGTIYKEALVDLIGERKKMG